MLSRTKGTKRHPTVTLRNVYRSSNAKLLQTKSNYNTSENIAYNIAFTNE